MLPDFSLPRSYTLTAPRALPSPHSNRLTNSCLLYAEAPSPFSHLVHGYHNDPRASGRRPAGHSATVTRLSVLRNRQPRLTGR